MTSGGDTYNRAAGVYRAVRPAYPVAVFERIESYASALRSVPRVLEVGAGTGQATRQMLVRGWQVVAVEPGADLARWARDDLSEVGDVEIRVSRFEDADLPDHWFDLLTSATAWHWVDPVVGLAKAVRVLRPGGTVALWWNAHVPDTTEPGWSAIRRVYEQIAPHLARLASLTPDRPDYDPAGELAYSPWFTDVEQHHFPFAVSYTAPEFLALIGTYASHRTLDESTRDRLHSALAETIGTELGGTVTKPYDCLLVLATAHAADR